MTTINKAKCEEIRQALQAALDGIEGLDVNFELGNFRFTDNKVDIKMTATANQNGKAVSKYALDFTTYAYKFGLKEEWLGQQIDINGEKFKVVGLKPRAYKNPVLIENSRGKTFVCSHRSLLTQLS